MQTQANDDAHSSEISNLVTQAGGWSIIGIEATGEGMGVFSTVWRVHLQGREAPATAIAKLPIDGPNGDAARRSGAYDRELLAYRAILTPSIRTARNNMPRTPLLYATQDSGALLLEDLGQHRFVDQLDGLDGADVLTIVDALHGLHATFAADPASIAELDVRRSAPSNFNPDQLHAGLDVIGGLVSARHHSRLARLVSNLDQLVDAFDQLPPTLCHGDPRADNLAFDSSGDVILFDWQQLAVQHGEADLAWLAATSIEADQRPSIDLQIVQRYADLSGQRLADVQYRYRLGFLLPGLAVLLLAQRAPSNARMTELVTTSIERISRAVDELDVVGAVLSH